MIKKIWPLSLVVLLIIAVLTASGCGAGSSATSGNGGPSTVKAYVPNDNIKLPKYPNANDKTYKFLNVMVSLPVPQAYYMFDKGLLAKEMKGTGYKAQEILDDVHQQVLPNFYAGYYDFAYVPVNVLSEYWSGRVLCQPTKWKTGDDYVIIAGDYNGGISLLTAPNVYSLKDLDGKNVGIMNPSYNLEMQLNKMLQDDGLKTKAVGGTVDTVHNFPGNIMNDLMNKKVSAVFAWDMYKPQLKALGFQQIRTWDQMGYGKDAPYMVLAVRKDILKNKPEVVKAVLRAHLQATTEAEKNSDFVTPTIEQYNKYGTSLERKQRPKESFQYKDIRVAYDPNYQYLKDTFDYMSVGKILRKPMKFDDLIDLNLFNQVLKAEKLPAVKE